MHTILALQQITQAAINKNKRAHHKNGLHLNVVYERDHSHAHLTIMFVLFVTFFPEIFDQ